MGAPLIGEFLTGDSKEIRDLANNEAALVGFLTLVKNIDDLPDVSTRFYEALRSLHQVTASGHSLQTLIEILAEFFGRPAKPPGKNLPVTLRFDPTVKYLGGIRKDQVLFLKKMKTGAFYGALWPWQRDKDKIEVLLGFHSSSMSDGDYEQLESLVQKFISKKKIESASDVGGQIHGISLPSFLQMSEMEGATYTLKVSSRDRTGHLYLDDGSLIAAQLGDQSGSEAAYRIISWDNASIQIEQADPDRDREIHDPLMHVMMESLKIKDEAEAEPPPPSLKPRAPGPPPAPPKSRSVKPPVAKPAARPTAKPAKKAATPKSVKKAAARKPAKKVTTPKPVKKTVAPVRKAVAEKPVEESPAPPPASPPLEKVTDRSIGKQNQMGMGQKWLIGIAVLIGIAILGVGAGKLYKKIEAGRRYERLIEELSSTPALDARIVRLLQYIKDNPEDHHRLELDARLKTAYAKIEAHDYEKTIADVQSLPIDEKFEKKALSIYTAFLTKYPQSGYTEKINMAIGGIGQQLGSAYFKTLREIATVDFEERHLAYRDYLVRFPDGAERESVQQMIADLAEDFFAAIEKQTAACDAQGRWDECIARCEQFLSILDDQTPAQRVRLLRAILQDKEDVAQLEVDAALAADDYVKARKLYADYLDRRPGSTQVTIIAERLADLDADLARQAEWQKTADYVTDSKNDIYSRIERLDRYLENRPTGPFSAVARDMRARLDPKLQDAIRARRTDAARRQSLARKQAELDLRTRERQRIQDLHNRVSGQLRPVAERFVDQKNGTVTDRITGLTWCLLDSYLDLGKCISYGQAKDYVRGLNTGGRSNWRLPSAGELATIYKNEPFFPSTGAGWYWTSESYVRGFHQVVDVVTTTPETVFTRQSKNENHCGAVRAVLP